MQRFIRLIPSGSVLLALTTLGSYLAGLLRDRTFAQTFGASRTLDAYNAAFLLPDFLFSVFVASGIAAAFVPIFSDVSRLGKEKSEEYANTVLTASVAVMGVLGALLIVFANPASRFLAPGFSAEDLSETARILRILGISPVFFAASNTLGAMLVAKRRFLYYGLSPIFYNGGIIAGTLVLAPDFGIMGTAIGTVAGALLHLIVRLCDAWKLGFRPRARWNFSTPEFKKTIRLMLPKMVGHPVELATFWGFTAIASGLATGSVVVLNFARNFESVPVSLIGIAVATAVFPALAEAASGGSREKFIRTLRETSWLILAASAAAALFMYVLREPIIAILLGGKAFGPEAIHRTAAVLGVFTLAIPTEALAQLLARAYYATKNTTIPVAASVADLIVAIGGAWWLAPRFDIFALPLAFAAASAVKIAILLVRLPQQLRNIGSPNRAAITLVDET